MSMKRKLKKQYTLYIIRIRILKLFRIGKQGFMGSLRKLKNSRKKYRS